MTEMQNYRKFLKTTLAAGAFTASGLVQAALLEKKEDRPDILFLMTEEQHYCSLPLTGNPYTEMPNMYRIAKKVMLPVLCRTIRRYALPF